MRTRSLPRRHAASARKWLATSTAASSARLHTRLGRLVCISPERKLTDVASLFAGTTVDARVLSVRIGDASALKMVYAAWTKGTAALLLAIGNVARATGVDDALQNEWALSLPGLPDAARRAASSASAKGWRWVGEMEEIASTFAAASQPAGFHSAAADVFRGT